MSRLLLLCAALVVLGLILSFVPHAGIWGGDSLPVDADELLRLNQD